jgi:hypothetical protein
MKEAAALHGSIMAPAFHRRIRPAWYYAPLKMPHIAARAPRDCGEVVVLVCKLGMIRSRDMIGGAAIALAMAPSLLFAMREGLQSSISAVFFPPWDLPARRQNLSFRKQFLVAAAARAEPGCGAVFGLKAVPKIWPRRFARAG